MNEKVLVAIFGAVFGFSLPYLASVWDRSMRARRMVAALKLELMEVSSEIEEKLKWVGRDVSEHLNEVDQERFVESKGIRLYLGEREEFVVPRAYWKAKYTEIVEAIGDKDFSEFFRMYRLVDKFEQKFVEMKMTFETSLGRKDVMALAVFEDLVAISAE
ncbi:MAG: hypothetical protein ABR956_18365, partial [Terracidiphilus sp.]